MDIIRCKVALVGEQKVGKTNLVSQTVKNYFNNTYQTTLGIEYNQHEVNITDTSYKVQFHFLDFSGYSPFRDLWESQIKDVNYVFYVYDCTSMESLLSIKLWQSQVKEYLKNKNVVEYLVGNKNEIPEKIVTDKGTVDKIGKELKMKTWSVSARLMTNVNELLEDVAQNCYKNYLMFVDKMNKISK